MIEQTPEPAQKVCLSRLASDLAGHQVSVDTYAPGIVHVRIETIELVRVVGPATVGVTIFQAVLN